MSIEVLKKVALERSSVVICRLDPGCRMNTDRRLKAQVAPHKSAYGEDYHRAQPVSIQILAQLKTRGRMILNMKTTRLPRSLPDSRGCSLEDLGLGADEVAVGDPASPQLSRSGKATAATTEGSCSQAQTSESASRRFIVALNQGPVGVRQS